MDYKMTKFVEFENKEIESTYFNNDVFYSSISLGRLTVIFSLFNLLWVLYDLKFLPVVFVHSLIPRVIIFIVSLIVYRISSRLHKKSVSILLLSTFLLFFYTVHIVFTMTSGYTDALSATFTTIFALLGISLIPNKWRMSLLIFSIAYIEYIIALPFIVTDAVAGTYIKIAIFLFWVVPALHICCR